MLTIDGSQMSGSGTIVRYAVALAALFGRPVRVVNARALRPQPGLRPQHVAGVRACAELCGARVEGIEVGSGTFEFTPGSELRGGRFEWDIGTAGSTTMLALSVLPVACFAAAPVRARITGGLFQDFAPSPYHFDRVLAPMLRSMGVKVSLTIERPGYVPGGAGIVELTVEPAAGGLEPLVVTKQGEVRQVRGVTMASHLADRCVSDRMASTCEERLRRAGLACVIDRIDDESAVQPGASLAIWGGGSTGSRLGADQAGKLGRSSEQIGRYVARTFLEDLRSGATVDRHLADQLVLFCAVARGESTYIVPRRTGHLESNLWLVEQFGVRTSVEGQRVVIDGVGLSRPAIAAGASS